MPSRKAANPKTGNYSLSRAKSRRRLPINGTSLTKIEPLTENQEKIFNAWDEGKHLFIYGCAGTGKTFCALYKALQDTLKDTPNYETIHMSGPL